MRRGDASVMWISAGLAAIVVAAVTYSVVVLDRTPSSAAFDSGDSNSSWLVVTWGPSLCSVEPSNLGCASGHVGEMGQTWVLHGLWPQPFDNQYCSVPRVIEDKAKNPRATDLPPFGLGNDTQDKLQSQLSDAAVMAPHEWYAHGTCSGVTPDVYFGDAANLADQVRKILDPMFKAAQGKRISATALSKAFDDAFGEGAGQRVNLSCRNVTGEGSVIYEVHMSLPPVTDLRTPEGELSLGNLLAKGPPLAEGCRGGRVP